MERIDVIIASVGAAAIVATVLGVVFYEELASVQDVTFDTMERQVASVTGVPVNTAVQFTPGMNATGAQVTVTLHHTGTAYNPDGGSARVDFVDANGTVHRGELKSFSCSGSCPSAQGTTLADLSWTFDVTFGTVPADTSTDDASSFDQNHTWMGNYEVRFIISPPSETVPSQLGASYTFNADITLSETYYMHRFVSDAPENI